MSLFPRIDQPCPLGVDEQRRIEGHCARCDKHVHALDDLSPEQRRSLLARADGPLCVSYRRPRGTRMAQAAVIAITLVAGSAFAGEDCTDGAAAPLVPVVQQGPSSPVPAQPTVTTQLVPAEEEPTELDELDMIVMGGISAPNEAEWVDDTTLPELPVITGDAPLPVRDSALD